MNLVICVISNIYKWDFLLKKNHRPQMVSLVLKPMILNLMAISTSPRNIILINQSGIFWSIPRRQSGMWTLSISYRRRGNLYDKNRYCYLSHKRCPSIKIIYSFLFIISFPAPPFFLQKPSRTPMCLMLQRLKLKMSEFGVRKGY